MRGDCAWDRSCWAGTDNIKPVPAHVTPGTVSMSNACAHHSKVHPTIGSLFRQQPQVSAACSRARQPRFKIQRCKEILIMPQPAQADRCAPLTRTCMTALTRDPYLCKVCIPRGGVAVDEIVHAAPMMSSFCLSQVTRGMASRSCMHACLPVRTSIRHRSAVADGGRFNSTSLLREGLHVWAHERFVEPSLAPPLSSSRLPPRCSYRLTLPGISPPPCRHPMPPQP